MIQLANWSQRRQVATIIMVAGVLIAALWFFLLHPQIKERRALERQILEMRSELERTNYYSDEEALHGRKRAILKLHGRIEEEWENAITNIGLFVGGGDPLAESVGHIDFKMALIEMQTRLNQKALAAGISVPPELGMMPTVESDEDARTLMIQLRSLEKLVDMLIDIEVSMVRDVEPMAPIAHSIGDDDTKILFEEYPIHIEFLGDLENLYDLYHAILEPGHVFALRRIRVNAASPRNDDLLRVRAILSALVFLKNPSEFGAPLNVKKTWMAPRGF